MCETENCGVELRKTCVLSYCELSSCPLSSRMLKEWLVSLGEREGSDWFYMWVHYYSIIFAQSYGKCVRKRWWSEPKIHSHTIKLGRCLQLSFCNTYVNAKTTDHVYRLDTKVLYLFFCIKARKQYCPIILLSSL